MTTFLYRRLIWGKRLKVNLLTALILGSENPSVLAERLQLPLKQQKIISESLQLKKLLNQIDISKEYLTWSPKLWCQKLEDNHWNQEAIAITIAPKTVKACDSSDISYA